MNKRIVILGGGESGVGAARLAHAKGFDVFLSDKGTLSEKHKRELITYQIPFEEGTHSEEKILNADEVIKSPGIPQNTPLMLKIREKKIKVSSEIDFASRYTAAKIVAITGTNGKTTTTLLTYHLLKTAGFSVGLAGNIGDSFARMVLEKNYDYYVLEISSFQLEDIHSFRPHVGVLLNITPDHLDRYDYQMNNYAAAKFRIIDYVQAEDFFIYNADDTYCETLAKSGRVKAQLIPFSNKFHQGDVLHIPHPFSKNLLTFKKLPLRGEHNALNMSAAILAALCMNVSSDAILTNLTSFKNAPHRLEDVATINGVLFINDSKATNVDSVKYALGAFKNPIVWIVGGIDKGNDYQLIMDLVKKHVKAIVCLGKNNQPIQEAFAPIFGKLAETQDMSEAIRIAFSLAQPNDVVLLSPACASFDLFKNYEDRGNQFREKVLELKKQLSEKNPTATTQ
ncbi:MAG: UDP-N-acetylmuramoyl-L-alanine--D-glutamate ligase [Flammeovirgaceae bacterium]|nr:UDP-N-acetylmuramoyl-L-alanine--D-glutamate ligase [Flammeovirgaceae bacterium]